MTTKDLVKLFKQLKDKFLKSLGEAHVLYGIIESELKGLWYAFSYKNKIAKPTLIEKKWKRIKKSTLGVIIEEIEFLSILDDGNINILRNKVNPDRNFLTHKIQNILYNDKRLNNQQNLIKINNDLVKTNQKLEKENKKLKIIAHDLNKRRLLLEKNS